MRLKEIVDRWNTGTCVTITESILVPEISSALKDWKINTIAIKDKWMLIGGILVGYYVRPRTTTDVDVIFMEEDEIPKTVNNFKRTRNHAFQHEHTHVEVEVLTPEYLKIPKEIVNHAFETSILSDGIRIPSVEGLIALKICRASFQDLADIQNICEQHDINLIDWPLPQDKLEYVEKQLNLKLVK